VLLDELDVGKWSLWVLVEPFQVRMRRCGVEVVVELLHVLAVIALAGHEAEEPLLQNRVALVPQRDGEDEHLIPITDGREAVLTPSVGTAPSVVMRKKIPRRPVRAVVLANGAPRTLRNVRAEHLPVLGVRGTEALVFLGVEADGHSEARV